VNNNDTLFDLPKHIESDKLDNISHGKPRLKIAIRNQVEIMTGSLDDLLPEDHKARSVWAYVEQLDLSLILNKIKSVESHPGASAIDPHILFALWLYAFIEGIISAKMVNRYCKEHIAFKWICGGVSVNEHTISDFRTQHGDAFDDILTQSIGVLSHQGVINIERVAQDGMKVRAHAGKSSFRREKTLKDHLKKAEDYVKNIKKDFKEDPSKYSPRQAVAKKRAAEDRVNKIKFALEELKKHQAQKAASQKKNHKSFSEEDKEKMRASKTDPQARVMKMPNSGFSPAYNVQFASECKSKAILGVQVVQAGHDYGQLAPMQRQLIRRYGKAAPELLADPGFLEQSDVDEVSKKSCLFIPSDIVKETKNKSETMLNMKKRMETKEAKEIYKERASTAEFVNARVRTRGLTQVLVIGLAKVQVVATLFAIGQNMLVWMSKIYN
jgi:transposase